MTPIEVAVMMVGGALCIAALGSLLSDAYTVYKRRRAAKRSE